MEKNKQLLDQACLFLLPTGLVSLAFYKYVSLMLLLFFFFLNTVDVMALVELLVDVVFE